MSHKIHLNLHEFTHGSRAHHEEHFKEHMKHAMSAGDAYKSYHKEAADKHKDAAEKADH